MGKVQRSRGVEDSAVRGDSVAGEDSILGTGDLERLGNHLSAAKKRRGRVKENKKSGRFS